MKLFRYHLPWLLVLAIVITIYQVKIQHVKTKLAGAAQDVGERYVKSIEHFAFNLAKEQARVGHATYIEKGLPEAAETTLGYPKARLGCMTLVLVVHDVGVDVKTPFVNKYNLYLEQHRKDL